MNSASKHRPKKSAIKEPLSEPESGKQPVVDSSAKYGRWAWLAAVLGASAGALAFDPVALRPLIVLAPLGCFLALRWSPTPRGAFLRALIFGWIYYLGALYWIFTVRSYVPDPVWPVLGVIFLGLVMALVPALAVYGVRRWLWPARPAGQYVVFACAWLLAEWLHTLGKLALPLEQFGHAWAVWPWAIQIAQWLGELGVSLEVLWLAGLILYWAHLWQARRAGKANAETPRPRLFWLAPALTVLPLLWFGYSAYLVHAWDHKIEAARGAQGARKLHVALLQPNIPQDFKFASYASPDESQRRDLTEQITSRQENMLAQNARPEWDLLILPETAFTDEAYNLMKNPALKARIAAMARGAHVDILFGGDHSEGEGLREKHFNCAYLVRADGTYDPHVYEKMRLVPFGENLPYFDLIPGFNETFVGISPFTEGHEQTIFETKGFHFGVMICFESTFSALARGAARRGADFLVAITNDAWYGPIGTFPQRKNVGAMHHFNVSLLRAVETRHYIVRCANTGISAIITPAGRIETTLGREQRGFIQGTILPAVSPRTTWFVLFGNGWLVLPGLILLAARVIKVRRKVISHPSTTSTSSTTST